MKRLISFITSLLVFLTACTPADVDQIETTPVSENAVHEYLTNVYVKKPLELPAEFAYSKEFTPDYDHETQTLTLLLTKSDYSINDDGAYTFSFDNMLVSYDKDGSISGTMRLPSADNESINSGVITDEYIYYVSVTWESTRFAYLNQLDRSTNEIKNRQKMYDIDSVRVNTSPNYIAVDSDGDIYLMLEKKIIILNSDFVCVGKMKSENPISSVTTLPDGSVYVCGILNGERSFSRIDKNSGSFETKLTLNNSTRVVSGAPDSSADFTLFFDDTNGIYGLSASQSSDGKAAKALLLDYLNSGIAASSGSTSRGSSEFIAMLDADHALFAIAESSDAGIKFTPAVYEKSDDIDLSSISVIELATAKTLEFPFIEKIVEFNGAHTDKRITVLDYTNSDDEAAGEWQLITDILNRKIAPDIVFDSLSEDNDSIENSVLGQLANRELFTDLRPLIENDSSMKDDVFSSVISAFSTDDGKMWGIAPYFTLSSLITTPELLGKYAASSNWTIENFLDFAASLPDGKLITQNATRENMGGRIVRDYTDFIDPENRTCSFDSDLFKRYLSYLMSLPTNEEYKRISGIGDVPASEIGDLYRNGVFALKPYVPYSEMAVYSNIAVFDTENYSIIGYPSSQSSGIKLSTEFGFMITSFTDSPEACFEILSSFCHIPNSTEKWSRTVGLPILKSEFDRNITALRDNYTIAYYADHTFMQCYRGGRSEDEIRSSIEQRGMEYRIIEITDSSVNELASYLDGDCQAILSSTPAAVNEIIEEEITNLLGGVGTVDSCANSINSRVSIWLSVNE